MLWKDYPGKPVFSSVLLNTGEKLLDQTWKMCHQNIVFSLEGYRIFDFASLKMELFDPIYAALGTFTSLGK